MYVEGFKKRFSVQFWAENRFSMCFFLVNLAYLHLSRINEHLVQLIIKAPL